MAAALTYASVVLSGQTDLYHVSESKALSEILGSGAKNWQGLSEAAVLKIGDRIRTDRQGSVEISGSPLLENAFLVGPDSQITWLNEAPARIALDQGELWILKEDPSEMRVLTPEYLAVIRDGGCRIKVSNGAGTQIQVFGESVRVFDKTPSGYSVESRSIEEGFQLVSGQMTRMEFADYSEWQGWYKKNDKRKDELTPRR